MRTSKGSSFGACQSTAVSHGSRPRELTTAMCFWEGLRGSSWTEGRASRAPRQRLLARGSWGGWAEGGHPCAWLGEHIWLSLFGSELGGRGEGKNGGSWSFVVRPWPFGPIAAEVGARVLWHRCSGCVLFCTVSRGKHVPLVVPQSLRRRDLKG